VRDHAAAARAKIQSDVHGYSGCSSPPVSLEQWFILGIVGAIFIFQVVTYILSRK
jgi:hypothetical protein